LRGDFCISKQIERPRILYLKINYYQLAKVCIFIVQMRVLISVEMMDFFAYLQLLFNFFVLFVAHATQIFLTLNKKEKRKGKHTPRRLPSTI
jgi:hypothetical protein